ncbi:hypothetical protein GCM10007071_21840 [Marinobacter zhanjiangensis]|uniref:Ice-binding protein C-terminal domain-containing protein n=2 Tax=Marinobacter zhanjiangensis TaxID=578215 RepID=A0ABQ3B1W5_9GAMM|nr:hypothetical protein GCM10007071_21840 [Marinobacter zhanjiangensis]
MLAASLVFGIGSAQAVPIPVDLELAMTIDVSGSVDGTDYALQRQGYVDAFNNASLQNDMLSGDLGQIAVSVFFFGTDGHQWSPGWQLIDSAAAAGNFATTLAGTNRPESGSTNIAAGIDTAAGTFGNTYIGTRQLIDVSGDGSQSMNGCYFSDLSCTTLQGSRDAFLDGSANRAINALWINDRDYFGNTGSETINSLDYGETNVIGGTDSFQLAISGFSDFGEAIGTKLKAEFTGEPPTTSVPEPTTLSLMLLGLLGLGASRRRLKAA